MKYVHANTLLEAQGIIASDISRGVFIFGANGSSAHTVRPRTDVASSEDSAHT